MREKGEISIMAKAFANTLAILLAMLGNFASAPTCSSLILILGDADIKISQTSLYEEARKSNCVNFA